MLTEEKKNILEYYFNKFDAVYVAPIVFIEFTIVLLLIFIIRWQLLFNIEKNKKKIAPDKLKQINSYLFGHCGLEAIAAFFICYCLVKLTNASPDSYIINIGAAPIISSIAAIYLDNKFILPFESDNAIGNLYGELNGKKNKKSDGSGGSDSSKSSENSVTININSDKKEDRFVAPSLQIIKPQTLSEKFDKLSEDIADDEDFNIKIINAINTIKEEQSNQSTAINDNNEKLTQNLIELQILKESAMIDKKLALKSMIYECLNQGYATPEQNDRVTMYYHSYKALGGNHEVETLYEQHYLKLQVHEDRRKPQSFDNAVYIDSEGKCMPDRREVPRIYKYGELDGEADE